MSPEKIDVLLALQDRVEAMTSESLVRSLRLEPTRLDQVIRESLSERLLVGVVGTDGECTWRLSEFGQRWLRENFFETSVFRRSDLRKLGLDS